MSQVKDFVPRLLGKLFVAFAVRRWGQQGSIMGGQSQSPMYGNSWTLGGYVVAVLATHIGARLFGKFISSAGFKQGGWDLILTKLVWTEGFARSPWLQQTFGQAEGQVQVGPDGQSWILQGGQWNAMQGIVESSPLDGIVESSPLDGAGSAYGHLLPADTPADVAAAAAYQGAGFTSPYDAAYATR
jgi:hypothetical protein